MRNVREVFTQTRWRPSAGNFIWLAGSRQQRLTYFELTAPETNNFLVVPARTISFTCVEPLS